jgi:hypothetical protein
MRITLKTGPDPFVKTRIRILRISLETGPDPFVSVRICGDPLRVTARGDPARCLHIEIKEPRRGALALAKSRFMCAGAVRARGGSKLIGADDLTTVAGGELLIDTELGSGRDVPDHWIATRRGRHGKPVGNAGVGDRTRAIGEIVHPATDRILDEVNRTVHEAKVRTTGMHAGRGLDLWVGDDAPARARGGDSDT